MGGEFYTCGPLSCGGKTVFYTGKNNLCAILEINDSFGTFRTLIFLTNNSKRFFTQENVLIFCSLGFSIYLVFSTLFVYCNAILKLRELQTAFVFL